MLFAQLWQIKGAVCHSPAELGVIASHLPDSVDGLSSLCFTYVNFLTPEPHNTKTGCIVLVPSDFG